MGDDQSKPPRRAKTVTDRELESERARQERERRARDRMQVPEYGAPLDAFDGDEFTPVSSVLDQIPDPTARKIVAVLWSHTANMTMRFRHQLEQSDGGSLRRDLGILFDDLGELRTDVVDIRGENGSGGALGEVSRQVSAINKRNWWFLTFVAGTLIAVLGAALKFGSWMGAVEADIESLKARASRRAPYSYPMPAEAPAKDTP